MLKGARGSAVFPLKSHPWMLASSAAIRALKASVLIMGREMGLGLGLVWCCASTGVNMLFVCRLHLPVLHPCLHPSQCCGGAGGRTGLFGSHGELVPWARDGPYSARGERAHYLPPLTVTPDPTSEPLPVKVKTLLVKALCTSIIDLSSSYYKDTQNIQHNIPWLCKNKPKTHA